MNPGRLDPLLSGCRKIGLDTSILICHFEDDAVFGSAASRILSKVSESLEAVVSTLAVTELLIRPFRSRHPGEAEKVVDLLRRIPNCKYISPDFDIAIEAARIRARYSLATVDSVHLATSLVAGADLFITNDGDFRKTLGKEKIKVVMLEDCLV